MEFIEKRGVITPSSSSEERKGIYKKKRDKTLGITAV
jgi:hypothetical protein